MQTRSIRWRITRGVAVYTAVLMIGMCAVYFLSTRYAQGHAVTQVLQQNERQLKDEISDQPDLPVHALIT
ncbi:MAG: hypothetical protein ABI210_14160, partial [Abditibacteriaceae bacterium]